MCPGVDSASKNVYQGFLLGVKAAGAWGWRPATLVVPNVKKPTRNPRGPSRPVTVSGRDFTLKLHGQTQIKDRILFVLYIKSLSVTQMKLKPVLMEAVVA
jgi:hypothetical protein